MRIYEEPGRRSSGRGAGSSGPPWLIKAMLAVLVVLAFVVLLSVMSSANLNFGAGAPAPTESVQPDAGAAALH